MTVILHKVAATCFLFASAAAAIANDVNSAPEFPRAITGRVTDVDGAPLAGALVEWGYFTDGPQDRETVETDAEGRYRLETSHVGRDFRIGVSHPGFAPSILDGVIPGPASAATSFDFQLSPGTNISLRIMDPAGNPVTGLDVTPYTPSNGFHSSFSSPVQPTPLPGSQRTVTTGEDGRVALADLPVVPDEPRKFTFPDGRPNPWNWLHVRLHMGDDWVHEFQITEAEIIASDSIDVTIPGYRVPGYERQDGMIRGRVVDRETGRPVTEYLVTLRHRPEPIPVSSSDGRFSYGTTLRNGREHQTRVFAEGYAVAIVRIVADSPEKAMEPTIELERHPSFQGRLVDASTGEPLPDIQIVAAVAKENGFNYVDWSDLDRYADGNHGLENVIRVITDDDGRFTVPEEPGRPVTLIVLTPEYGRRIIPPARRMDPDATGVVPVALQPAASATSIALRETQLGALANAVTISHQSDDGFEHMYHATPLDESGELRFDSLNAGEYRLSLYLSTRGMSYPCYSKAFTLEPGEDRDVLLGDMPGTLRIHGVADPFAMVRIYPTFPAEISNFAVQADVDGRFELRDLFPGEYTVSTDGYRASSGFRIDGPSQTIELTADLELNLTRTSRALLEASE